MKINSDDSTDNLWCGSDGAWNNKQYTSHSEQDKLFLWPQPHLRDTIVSNQTSSSSEPNHYTELPGHFLKIKTCMLKSVLWHQLLAWLSWSYQSLHTGDCPQLHLPGHVWPGTLRARNHSTQTRRWQDGPWSFQSSASAKRLLICLYVPTSALTIHSPHAEYQSKKINSSYHPRNMTSQHTLGDRGVFHTSF